MRSLPSETAAFVAQAPMHRRAIAQAVATAAASLAPGTRVLDAGAGDAPYRPLFAHCSYQTQDWPGSVHAGATAADVVADLHALPPDLGQFDCVICTEVLEHVARPEQVLSELHRVLRPRGLLLVTVPFVGPLHEEPNDYRRYTSHGLRRQLEDAGFTEIAVAPLGGYYSMLAHVLRFAGLATQPLGAHAPGPLPRALALMLLAVSKLLGAFAPRLDGLDTRRALPVGWIGRAHAASTR